MHSRICGRLKSVNHKNYWVRKSQIRKVSRLQKVRKFAEPICGLPSAHLRLHQKHRRLIDKSGLVELKFKTENVPILMKEKLPTSNLQKMWHIIQTSVQGRGLYSIGWMPSRRVFASIPTSMVCFIFSYIIYSLQANWMPVVGCCCW